MALRLRSARAQDAPAIVELHVASWRDAYRGVLDDAFLDGPMAELMARHWQDALAVRRRPGVVMMATAGGDPVGFIAAWREGTNAHVDNLHVKPGMRGAGIGRALLGFAAGRMQSQGCVTADLRVFAGNLGAIRFYRSLGGTMGPEEPGVAFGHPVTERHCTWPDIGALIAAAARPKGR
jgi:ribosomal protein S18 acetylase RimI-like enzyme